MVVDEEPRSIRVSNTFYTKLVPPSPKKIHTSVPAGRGAGDCFVHFQGPQFHFQFSQSDTNISENHTTTALKKRTETQSPLLHRQKRNFPYLRKEEI